MPPTVKDAENLTATSPSDTGIKQQPVALEVPVTVNGARTVEGSAKREPFSESTKTVLIFGTGAVIRLSSSVAPGQLLFLTNEKTKKEVVCQVVKSKNYRNVSGYVELEFTEPVVGFWGMRFPGDRIGSAPQGAHAQVANVTPSVVPAKPVVPVSAGKDAALKPAETKSVIPATTSAKELLPQKPIAPVAPLSSTRSTSFDPEAPLSIRSTTPREPVVPVVAAAPVAAAPPAPVDSPLAQPVTPAPVIFDSPRPSEVQASILEPPNTPAVPPASTVANLLALFEAKPAAAEVDPPPAVEVCADPETETLKRHTSRLQEQLSNMMFSAEPETSETVSVQIPHASPVVIQKELADNAQKALEQAKTHTPAPYPAAPVKLEPPIGKSLLEDEELKIPAWLEPLARNAAAPSSTQELIDREKAKRLAEQPVMHETVPETVTAVEENHIPELPLPTFSGALPREEERSTRDRGSRSSGKGMLVGAIAAGVLALAGGGWWYMQQQTDGVHVGPGTASASNVQASVASLPVASSPSPPRGNALPQANPPAQAHPLALTKASAQSKSSSNSLSVVPAVASAATTHNSQLPLNPVNAGAAATTSASAPPPVGEPKKPILGEVHLAKPKVLSGRHTQNVGEPDAGITFRSEEQPDTESLNGGLVVDNQPSAPTAPLPVGGDVKQAKLIFSVPPVYPMLAKNQHVSGNVTVDALIDAGGRVTTMKIVSGPTLLQQAAMDALKQWKYQPATLDGKAVPMHLTVTIQFRLQ